MYNKIKECVERNILNRQRKCEHDYEFNDMEKNLPTSVKNKNVTVRKKEARIQSAGARALLSFPHPLGK